MYSTREGSRDMAHPDISSLTTGKNSSVLQNRNKIIIPLEPSLHDDLYNYYSVWLKVAAWRLQVREPLSVG